MLVQSGSVFLVPVVVFNSSTKHISTPLGEEREEAKNVWVEAGREKAGREEMIEAD